MTTFEERDRETADLVLVALGGDGAPAAVAAEVAHVLERSGLPAVLPPLEDGQEQEPSPKRGWLVPPYLSRTDGALLDALARVLRAEPQWDADTVFRLWLLVVARRPGVARPRTSFATSVVDPGDELLAA